MRAASDGSCSSNKPHTQIGAPDAAAGINARAQQKAEMPRLGRPGEPRGIHQRGQAHLIAAAQRNQAFRDESAVKALERHHIGNGAERDQMQQRQQIGLRPRRRPEIAGAQRARERDQRDKYKTDRRQMAKAGQIVGAVRIDDRDRRRQFLVGLVMIDHDGVEAELLGLGERLQAGGAAIDRDQ